MARPSGLRDWRRRQSRLLGWMLRPAASATGDAGKARLLRWMLRPAASARRRQSRLLRWMLRPAASARRRQSRLLRQEPLEEKVAAPERVFRAALVALVRLGLLPRSEVRRRNSGEPETGHVGPGLLGLERDAGERAEALQERIVEDGIAGRGAIEDLALRPEPLREGA